MNESTVSKVINPALLQFGNGTGFYVLTPKV